MKPDRLDTVAVIGNGIIGHGVAQVFAAAGRSVVMIGRSPASLARAVERIAAELAQSIGNYDIGQFFLAQRSYARIGWRHFQSRLVIEVRRLRAPDRWPRFPLQPKRVRGCPLIR